MEIPNAGHDVRYLFDQLVLGSDQRLLFRQFKGRLELGRPLLCLHQALPRGRLCKSQRLDCRPGNMSGMSFGLTLLVTGTGTGNKMGRLCVRLFLWRPLSPPARWPSPKSIAGHLGRFEFLGRTELERLRN